MTSIVRSYSYGEGAPDGLYTGIRAETVQFYPEANIKNGLQFYTRSSWPLSNPIASGASSNIHFKTGSKKVIVKVRIVHYAAEEIELSIIESPTIEPDTGTLGFVGNYNKVNPVQTTVEIRKDVTFAGGVPIDDEPEYYFGSNATAQRAGNSVPEGRERVLPPNTEFIVKITNTGTGNARVQYFLDWYEGEPDLPRID